MVELTWVQDPGFSPKSGWRLLTQYIEYYTPQLAQNKTITQLKFLAKTIDPVYTNFLIEILAWVEN